jgi:hypothetical protein
MYASNAYQSLSHLLGLLNLNHPLILSYMSHIFTNNLSGATLPALPLYASKCRKLLCLLLPKYTTIINCNVPTMSITSINIFKHYKNKSYIHLLIHYNITNINNLLLYCPICHHPDNAPHQPPQYAILYPMTIKQQDASPLSSLVTHYSHDNHTQNTIDIILFFNNNITILTKLQKQRTNYNTPIKLYYWLCVFLSNWENFPDLPQNQWKTLQTTPLQNFHSNTPIAVGTHGRASNHHLREGTITTNGFVQTPLQLTKDPVFDLQDNQPFLSHHKQDLPLRATERGLEAKTSPPHTKAHGTDDIEPQIQIVHLSRLPKRRVVHPKTQATPDQFTPTQASQMHSYFNKRYGICKKGKGRNINAKHCRDKQETEGGILITLTQIKNRT